MIEKLKKLYNSNGARSSAALLCVVIIVIVGAGAISKIHSLEQQLVACK